MRIIFYVAPTFYINKVGHNKRAYVVVSVVQNTTFHTTKYARLLWPISLVYVTVLAPLRQRDNNDETYRSYVKDNMHKL